jgi:hypothetical protein
VLYRSSHSSGTDANITGNGKYPGAYKGQHQKIQKSLSAGGDGGQIHVEYDIGGARFGRAWDGSTPRGEEFLRGAQAALPTATAEGSASTRAIDASPATVRSPYAAAQRLAVAKRKRI